MPKGVSADAQVRRLRSVIRWSWITLALLLVQDLLGMLLNLYVDLASYPTIEDAFRSAPVLGIHVLTGFAVIASSAYILVRAVGTGEPRIQLAALAGLGFVLLAFLSGVEFTFFGQVDAFSFLMETGFVGILGCIAVVLALAHGSRSRPAVPGPLDVGPAPPSQPRDGA